jgi:hypothetical protein
VRPRVAARSRSPQTCRTRAAGKPELPPFAQVYYDGSAQSVAFGFAPDRSLSRCSSVPSGRTSRTGRAVRGRVSAERGGTEQFVSAGVRYAFTRRCVSPYVLGLAVRQGMSTHCHPRGDDERASMPVGGDNHPRRSPA